MIYFLVFIVGLVVGWILSTILVANLVEACNQYIDQTNRYRERAEEDYKDISIKAHEIKQILENDQRTNKPLSEEGLLKVIKIVYNSKETS